jgi:hypothetical protein
MIKEIMHDPAAGRWRWEIARIRIPQLEGSGTATRFLPDFYQFGNYYQIFYQIFTRRLAERQNLYII